MIYTHALAALLAAAIAGGGAWTVQGWRYEAREAERIQAAAEHRRNQEKAASQAAIGFERERSRNEIRYRTVTREVEKIVERPVYGNACLDDDGLRWLNDQIRRAADPGEPGLKLPSAS